MNEMYKEAEEAAKLLKDTGKDPVRFQMAVSSMRTAVVAVPVKQTKEVCLFSTEQDPNNVYVYVFTNEERGKQVLGEEMRFWPMAFDQLREGVMEMLDAGEKISGIVINPGTHNALLKPDYLQVLETIDTMEYKLQEIAEVPQEIKAKAYRGVDTLLRKLHVTVPQLRDAQGRPHPAFFKDSKGLQWVGVFTDMRAVPEALRKDVGMLAFTAIARAAITTGKQNPGKIGGVLVRGEKNRQIAIPLAKLEELVKDPKSMN